MILKKCLTIFCVFVSLICVSQNNNVCTKSDASIDLNSIGKCAIKKFKKSNSKEYIKVSTITTRNRFVRNRKKLFINKRKKEIAKKAELTIASVDNIPVFKNCSSVSFENRLQCFNQQISEHISTNLIYPKEAFQNKIEDKVSITFIIGKEGIVKSIKAKSTKNNSSFENEAKRIISSLPPFIPAKHKGEIRDVKHEIHIDFELSNEDKTKNTNLIASGEGVINDYLRFDIVSDAPVFVDCADYAGDSKQNCVKETIVNTILENLTYPFDAASQGIEGRVWVRFIVDKEGYVTNITTEGPANGELLEEEAKRLVTLLPKFVSGKHNGAYVNVEYFIPIDFQLNE